MQCSNVNPGAVQKAEPHPRARGVKTPELNVNRNAVSSREQLRLQMTPKGGVHSNAPQL